MKLIIFVASLCIFESCFSAPKSKTSRFKNRVVKRGLGLKNQENLWPKVNGQVIIPWSVLEDISKNLF